jgi:hypothetical protein
MATKHMSPAEREAREMIAEMKMQKAVDAAYNRADQTEPAPMVEPRPMPRPAPRPMPAQAMPQDQMGNATGMKKGGKVKDAMYMSFNNSGKSAGMKPVKMAAGGSASSRADGCATKGKTKGTMVTMKNGGMC